MKLRGILSTRVSDAQVVLCKAAPVIRDAYEIRLTLFMAIQSARQFVLAVTPAARVDPTLEAHIRQNGGDVVRATFNDHSVYIGTVDGTGAEGDGWVAGDEQSWATILAGFRSGFLREKLSVGGSITMSDLSRLRDALMTETISGRNIDDEDIQQALLRLVSEATRTGGSLFVQ